MRRIAILLANNDESAFARRFPDDAQKVRTRLLPLRPAWQFETVAVRDGAFPASPHDFDGYVITGSPASVNQKLDWIKRLSDFIMALHQSRTPTVGLCFGHQAIAAALGGTVGDNPQGWGLGVEHTQFTRFESWMVPQHESVALFAAHNEQVLVPPERARILGSNPTCPVASFAIDDHFFTTEYHPELTEDFMRALIDALSSGLDPGIVNRARQQIKQSVDGDLFAKWMVNFLDRPRT